jgi:transcriptional regulator with XRE-family HTH domain
MEESTLASFGEMLKMYRKQRGLTQQQLARKLAMHHNTIGAWERGNYLPATRGMIMELARCLRLNEVETHHLLDAGLTTVASRWNVPYQRNPFFVGRQRILQSIHEILKRDQQVVCTRSCALSGMPGIGKTQTALEYAYLHALDYSAIFWIRAETEESITGSFIAMATTLKLPVHHLQTQKQVIAMIHDWLASHHNWLLIFDNIERIELAGRFLPASREGSLLFTTRRLSLGSVAPCLEMSPLSLEESMHLLSIRANSQLLHVSAMTTREHEERSIRDLAIALGGLPLAIEQVAACIEELHCSFSRFLCLFQQDALQMLQERPSSMFYAHSVAETFIQAFERLQQDNPVGADLLMLCCFLAPNDIPEELLIRGKSYLGPELQTVLSNPIQFNATFKDVLASALLSRNTRTETLSVHRLVQVVLKENLSEIAQRTWIERLISILNQLFLLEWGQLDVEHWVWYEQLLPHAQAVLQVAERLQLFSSELGSLLSKIAIYHFYRARLPVDSEDVRSSVRLVECEEEDFFETFLQQRCVLSAQCSCRAADLWQAYKKWVRTQENVISLSRQAFSFRLKMKGCSPVRTSAYRSWRGIDLKVEQRSDEYRSLVHKGLNSSMIE